MGIFLTTLLQANTGWRPDVLSFLAGLLVGVGLTVLFYRALPRLLQLRDQSVSRVRETQLWVRAGVEQRFQAETAGYVQRYHLGGQWAELASIYIEPRLLGPAEELSPNDPPGIAARHLMTLWPELAMRVPMPPLPSLSVRRLLLNGRRVLISAPAGTGKTTLLAYCAHLCATAESSGPYTFLLPVIPIFVHLGELDVEDEQEDPAAVLAAALQRRAGPLTAPGLANLVQQKLAAGHALLLLDGWDERRPEQFPLDWLRRLLELYPDNRVIIASPLRHYGPLLDLDFVLSTILPWRAGQATQLKDAWAAAHNNPRTLRPHHFWRPGATPLETTLTLWQQTGYPAGDAPIDLLPENSLRLYEPLLEIWLESDERVLRPVARALWESMALALLVDEKTYLTRPEVESLAEAILMAQEAEPRLVQALWRQLQHCPLFVHWPAGRVAFRNPLWRDYLAASYMAREEEHNRIAAHVHDPFWADVVRFYVACKGESGLAEQILDPRTGDPLRENLFQATSWLPEVAAPGEWQRQTLIQLGQLIVKSGVPQVLRQRAVAALSLTGAPGVMALLRQLMQRSEPQLRQAAALALANQPIEVALPALEKLLADGDVTVRMMAVYALAWLGDPAAERPVLLALIDRDAQLRQAVAAALALNGGESWQVLREATEYDELAVRRSAVQGLSLLDDYWAVELLEKISLEDPEWAVKSAANAALESIAERNQPNPWQPQQAGDLHWLVDWAVRRQRAVPAGHAAIPMLLELLEQAQTPDTRRAAAYSLAQVQIPPAERAQVEEKLKQAWMDGDPTVQNAAFAAWASLRRAYAPVPAGVLVS